MAWQRTVHDGRAWGAIWAFLVFFSGIMPPLFVVTGTAMWWLEAACTPARARSADRRSAGGSRGMNAFALHSEEFGSRACEADTDDYRPQTLAGFAPKSHVRLRSNRAVGIAAVAVIHGLLALGFVFRLAAFLQAGGPAR